MIGTGATMQHFDQSSLANEQPSLIGNFPGSIASTSRRSRSEEPQALLVAVGSVPVILEEAPKSVPGKRVEDIFAADAVGPESELIFPDEATQFGIDPIFTRRRSPTEPSEILSGSSPGKSVLSPLKAPGVNRSQSTETAVSFTPSYKNLTGICAQSSDASTAAPISANPCRGRSGSAGEASWHLGAGGPLSPKALRARNGWQFDFDPAKSGVGKPGADVTATVGGVIRPRGTAAIMGTLPEQGALTGIKQSAQTVQLLHQHSLKVKSSRYVNTVDEMFAIIRCSDDSIATETLHSLASLIDSCWVTPRIGADLVFEICAHIRDQGYLLQTINAFCSNVRSTEMRVAAAEVLERVLVSPNRHYLIKNGLLEVVVSTASKFTGSGDELKCAIALIEALFKDGPETCSKMIEMGMLDFILNKCKEWKQTAGDVETLRHAALALANLALFGESNCHKQMAAKKIPEWLFLLASHRDSPTAYYACLAICQLVSNKEIESTVVKSGTLSLVEPFIQAHKPENLVNDDKKLQRGRPLEWLERLVPMLSSARIEAKGLACFHFCCEAIVKKRQQRMDIIQNLRVAKLLKEIAGAPNEVASKLASQALKLIGEQVPNRLSQHVPLWTVDEVQYWVSKVGFETYARKFAEQMVDGDLLLLLTEQELERDIGIASGIHRKRFLRELESLKVDPSRLDRLLASISPQLSVYAYQMLEMGVDVKMLMQLTDPMLENHCGIINPVHRIRLLQALQECQTEDDMDVAILRKSIDIFISYRRSNGNQLASLIKVLLQLRGYKVFIDVDRLYAGQFDSSLLKNIRAARHFILVLTEGSLDRLFGDDACADWVHKEILCALQHHKSIIPVFDANFEYPEENLIPDDIRVITRLNGVRWVHEYQDACLDKVERFLKGEQNPGAITTVVATSMPPWGHVTTITQSNIPNKNPSPILARRNAPLSNVPVQPVTGAMVPQTANGGLRRNSSYNAMAMASENDQDWRQILKPRMLTQQSHDYSKNGNHLPFRRLASSFCLTNLAAGALRKDLGLSPDVNLRFLRE